MARDVSGNDLTPSPKQVVHIVRIKYWDGAVEQEIKLSTASQDLVLDVGGGDETWVGTGVVMDVGSTSESGDLNAPGVDIIFDGVNQSIMAVIANNQFRGRPITIWRVWLDSETGEIVAPGTGPVQIFDGFQNEPYNVSESFSESPEAVSISTRAVGALSLLSKNRIVKSNVVSHNEMLESAGLATGDTFFQNSAAVEGRDVYWGRDEPGEGKKRRFVRPRSGPYANDHDNREG